MRLTRLTLTRYRKARNVTLDFNGLIVLIGPNGAGKSNILDALRLLRDAVRSGSFDGPVYGERGGPLQVAWKGEPASSVEISTTFANESETFDWRVTLVVERRGFRVHETLKRNRAGQLPTEILHNDEHEQWWGRETPTQTGVERLSLGPTECALAAAAKNEAFAGRAVFECVRGWLFADPNPGAMRIPCGNERPDDFDVHGRDLPVRLKTLAAESPERHEVLVRLLRQITGLATEGIEVTELDDGRFGLSVREEGLHFRVHQQALSAGTLRTMGILVLLVGLGNPGLVGLEEPENYLHPRALQALVELLSMKSSETQVVVTTHSPLLLDYLNDRPEVVRVVTATAEEGTRIRVEASPDTVRKVLAESGFSLGEYHLSFGGFKEVSPS